MRNRVLVVLLVFLIVTFVVKNEMFSKKHAADVTVPAYLSSEKKASTHEIATNKKPLNFDKIDGSDTIENAGASEIELLETEEILIDMVQEYEHVNTEPELRKAQREKMAEKLSIYNDQVLSIALEKMKERELDKTE